MLARIQASIRSLIKLNRVSALIYSFVVPLIVGVLAVHYQDLIKIDPLLFWLPTVLLIIAALVFAYYTWDVVLPAEYYLEMEGERKRNDSLASTIIYMSLLQEQIHAWNVMLRGFLQRKLHNPAELHAAIAEICKPIVDRRDEYFQFKRAELWNFAVYLWNEQRQRLVPVWRDRHEKHPSQAGLGREWGDGEGHVGHAFHGKITMITPDASDAHVRAFIIANPNNRDYDLATYCSYVSQPISQSDGAARPFGVIVATSNIPGRFDQANALVLNHASIILATTIQLAYDEQR